MDRSDAVVKDAEPARAAAIPDASAPGTPIARMTALRGRVPQGLPASKRGRKATLAICLSGGGYRAMLFHAGVLRRLNELGVLAVCDRVSSVSGGSIAAGVLAHRWRELEFDGAGVAVNWEVVENALLAQGGRRIDVLATVTGVLPGTTAANQVARHYRRRLFGTTTLQDLPDHPRFVFTSTNVVTGTLMRWSKSYAADYSVGQIRAPRTSLASVVASSSAFPPFLSPLRMRVREPFVDFEESRPVEGAPTRLWLTDGGVYDNLGLQPADQCHTVLASDAGMPFGQRRPRLPDWFSQLRRVTSLIDRQVRARRREALMDELTDGQRYGALWTIDTPMSRFPASGALPCPIDATQRLARIPTRLWALRPADRDRLVNWGYACADAAVRSYLDPDAEPPERFPRPGGVG
jgi:NTE family protein